MAGVDMVSGVSFPTSDVSDKVESSVKIEASSLECLPDEVVIYEKACAVMSHHNNAICVEPAIRGDAITPDCVSDHQDDRVPLIDPDSEFVSNEAYEEISPKRASINGEKVSEFEQCGSGVALKSGLADSKKFFESRFIDPKFASCATEYTDYLETLGQLEDESTSQGQLLDAIQSVRMTCSHTNSARFSTGFATMRRVRSVVQEYQDLSKALDKYPCQTDALYQAGQRAKRDLEALAMLYFRNDNVEKELRPYTKKTVQITKFQHEGSSFSYALSFSDSEIRLRNREAGKISEQDVTMDQLHNHVDQDSIHAITGLAQIAGFSQTTIAALNFSIDTHVSEWSGGGH